MKLGLKKKLIAAFFLFTTIPLTALGIFSYISTSSSMQTAVEHQLTSQSTNASQSINNKINSVSKYIEMLSLDNRLSSVASGDNKYSGEVYQYLSMLQKQNSNQIELLAVLDASGKEILNSQSENVNIDLSSRDYVKNALAGNPSTSEVLQSKTTGKTVIAIAYPLKNNDKIVGAVLTSIQLENICTDISKIKIGNSGYAYMIDKNGLIVYHPDSKKILKEKISDIKNNDLNSLIDNVKSGKQVQGYYTLNGVRKFAVLIPANNWFVVITADYNEYMSSAIWIKRITIIIMILFALISVLTAYFVIANKIVNPIKQLESLMTTAGKGDFTVKSQITTGDEIQVLGEYFNDMIEGQGHIIKNIRNYADELAASSEEVSASSQEISASTEEIASNIQQVAESAEHQNGLIVDVSEVLVQLSSLVQIAQSKASTAKNSSENTMNVAHDGRSKVEKTVDAIENISKSSYETERVLNLLEGLSKKVNGIINTINDISEQTNLLALNAAIEAARAGEHGKGFTVVADEVRKLSEQTNTGANEISSLIGEMTNLIGKAVESMNSGKKAVENGVSVVKDTDESFISIINAIEQIGKDIKQIVDVTKDEVASSDQIVKLIDSVASITEKTTANSQQVAAAVEEQAATSQNVAESVQQTSEMAISMDKLIEKYIV